MLKSRPGRALLWCAVIACLPASPALLAEEDVAELDAVEVNAARESEILARIVMLGLQRKPSHKLEDANKIVCERSARTGTNIRTIRCATNATWLNVGQASKSANAAALASISGSSTDPNQVAMTRLSPLLARAASHSPYSSRQFDGVREGKVLEFGSGIQRMRAKYPGDEAEQDQRLKRLFAVDEVSATLRASEARGVSAERIVAFAATQLALQAEPDASPERRAELLAREGLDQAAFDAFTARLATEVRLEVAVARAREALSVEF